ncbi:MAG: CHASE2 domain-containing protein [Candidatus Thiodiazotropha taylori]|nr:CHASE2 domain-containing protein [Candidatus Thiodiazotropha taylori]
MQITANRSSEQRTHRGLPEPFRSALILALFTALFAASGWLHRWDLLLYDLQMGVKTVAPSDDIVIVAIDEKSLRALGRWPWSRRVHAELVDRLTQSEAKAIVFDILMAEEDRTDPQADVQLIQSVAASERVFMPVITEQIRQGGMLVESMPLPALSNVVAGLGHVHIDLDADGIARGVYLYEGLGQAYWPQLMLSLLNWLNPEQHPLDNKPLPHQQHNVHLIRRHTHRLIPFTGPAGHYNRYSYSQVLEGDYMADMFRDRIVLVGVTATGIGDALPTPLSGYGVPMPGVEINANILDSLRRNEVVTPVSFLTHLLGSTLVVMLPFLFYPFFPTRAAPLVSVALLMGFVLVNWILLRGIEVWFPPSAVLLGLTLSYPLWSWRRLDQAVRYLNEQLERIHREQSLLPVHLPAGDMSTAMQFLSRLMPLQGWVVHDARSGERLMGGGEALGEPLEALGKEEWQRSGAELWTLIERPEGDWQLGLSWPRNAVPEGRALGLVSDFAYQFSENPETDQGGVLERVELRLRQMRVATARIQRFRNLIRNAVGQMDDGLMVINSHGQVVMSNPRSAFYLGHETDQELLGEDAYKLLKVLEVQGGESWEEIFKQVMLADEPIRFEAIRRPDTELFVQLKSLQGVEADTHGMIVNLSYIGTLKRSERTRAKMLNFLSHDIRSPITSLLSLTQSQKKRQGSAEVLAEEIEPLARRSLKLADDFLRLARAEAVEVASFIDTDFISVTCNALDEIYSKAKEHQVNFKSEFSDDEIWLLGDPSLLERALFNLMENAVKFSPPESQVEVKVYQDQGSVICDIIDQGAGIPEDQLQEIFLPFIQSSLNALSDIRGVGLGLSFVKVVADKHHGKVTARNNQQSGTTFSLSIPCESESPIQSNN